MFYLRGLMVSFSAFVLLYLLLSILVVLLWRVSVRARRWRSANTLFVLRTAPLTIAVVSMLGIIIPSFLWFEPRDVGEVVGVVPIALTVTFFAYACAVAWRASAAYRRTQRSIRDWTRDARQMAPCAGVTCYQSQDAPPVALGGIARPALVISSTAAQLLTPQELRRTIEHELEHFHARDNLKKLFLHACAFPFMGSLERSWLDALEYNADAAAVSSESEALDLASALVKISRLRAGQALPELASGLVDGSSSLLQARIQRLIGWSPEVSDSSRRRRWIALTTLSGLSALIVAYPFLLETAHVLTEALVR